MKRKAITAETRDLDEMTERALRAWFRLGPSQLQPCAVSSGREGNLIILRNVNGELARYRITGPAGQERLRKLADRPRR